MGHGWVVFPCWLLGTGTLLSLCEPGIVPEGHCLPSHAYTEQDLANASKDPSVALSTAPFFPVLPLSGLPPLSYSRSAHLTSKLCLLISERQWPLLMVSLSAETWRLFPACELKRSLLPLPSVSSLSQHPAVLLAALPSVS